MPARASLRYIFPVILFAGIFSLATRDLTDPDFWWHLRTGELIWQIHSVPRVDPFSYTCNGKPWIAHEWLSEILFYAAYRSGGLALLILLFALTTAVAYFFVYRRCSGTPYIAGLLTLLGAMATVPTWGVRPQVFSMFLASLFLLLLERARANRLLLWALPPLMLLWANLHGGFAIGLVFLAAYWLGSLIEHLQNRSPQAKSLPSLQALSAGLIATALAVVVNPNGTKLYRYPIDTLRLTSLPRYVSEWRPPGLHEPRFLIFFGLLAATFSLMLIRRTLPRTHILVLLVLTSFGALHSVRHIPMFVLIAVPVLSQQITGILKERTWAESLISRTVSASELQPVGNWRLNVLLLATALVLFGLNVVRVSVRQRAVESKVFPEGATSYLLTHTAPTPLLNSYNWGGYFIWKLYPRYLVWVDGRTDLYGDAFMNDFALLYNAQSGWQEKLHDLGIRSVVLPPSAPLALALGHSSEWQASYKDDQSIVLTQTAAEPR